LYLTTGHFHTCSLLCKAYFPFNSWLSFQRLRRLLWGLTVVFTTTHAYLHLPALAKVSPALSTVSNVNADSMTIASRLGLHRFTRRLTLRCPRQLGVKTRVYGTRRSWNSWIVYSRRSGLRCCLRGLASLTMCSQLTLSRRTENGYSLRHIS